MEHRGARHKRTVTLWPQLSGILKPYIAGLGRDTGLLFASPRHGGMLDDVRWQLDLILKRAKITNSLSPGSEKRRLTRGVRDAVSRCGGSVWESNPPEPPKAPPSGFEDRASHQAKSAPPGQATL